MMGVSSPRRTEVILCYLVLLLACRNGWLICTASKSFAVYAATAIEKAEWIAHINKCVEDLLRKSKLINLFSFSDGENS